MKVMLKVNNALGEFVGAINKLEIPNLLAARDDDWKGLKCFVKSDSLEIEGESFSITNHQRHVGKRCWDSVEMNPCSVALLLALLNEAHWEIVSVEQAIASGWIVPIRNELISDSHFKR